MTDPLLPYETAVDVLSLGSNLDLTMGATLAELQAAYRQLAAKWQHDAENADLLADCWESVQHQHAAFVIRRSQDAVWLSTVLGWIEQRKREQISLWLDDIDPDGTIATLDARAAQFRQ